MSRRSVAIIGAGISGISCARALSAAGLKVTLFEKSRSLGGRCASRKWEGHIVDHGAQYLTIRDNSFRAALERLCVGDLRPILTPVVDAAGQEVSAESVRWYHARGNNRIGEALLGRVPVCMQTPIFRLEKQQNQWLLADTCFDAVVSSMPWPQTLALLGEACAQAFFDPCLTAIFSYTGDALGNSAQVYARSHPGQPLAWSACENHKTERISPGQSVFIAQASPEFSRDHLDADPLAWAAPLQQTLEDLWHIPSAARLASFTHRWRYARFNGAAPIRPTLPERFYVTGDACAESRIESAWLAGCATAARILFDNNCRTSA